MLDKDSTVLWGLWLYPCSFLWTAQVGFSPLELLLRISLGMGASYGEHHLSIAKSHCVWCLFYWLGRGKCRRDVEQKHSV